MPMLFPIKITIFFILVLAGILCFLIAYKRWAFALRLIFGKKALKKKAKGAAALQRVYLYAFGGFLIFIALMILF